MDKFLKDILEKAKAEGAEVHVVHMNASEPKCEEPCECEGCCEDEYAEAKKYAAEIATLNKILYEAHIEAGFSNKDALRLTLAVINS